MKTVWIIGAASAILITPCACAEPSLTLAERGRRSPYSIVLPDDASPSQKTAADELREGIRRATGVDLPVVSGSSVPRGIFLGNGAPDLGPDGFRIVVRAPHLHIEGGKIHGTLFGVNDFLERHAGFGWFSSKTEVVPRLDRLTVPADLDEVRKPAFEIRDMSWRENQQDVRFAARLKLNGFRIPYPETYGGQNHLLDTNTYGTTFNAILPVSKHFDAHPDWYAEINGRRTKVHTQLCLSNPEVVAVLTSNVFARIRERYPRSKYFGLAQNDWYTYCKCARCRAIDEHEESPAGSIIHFLNKIAAAVEKDYPDVIIHTLAYMYSLKPPRYVRARKNVMIVLCTDACDFSKPIETSRWLGCANFRRNLDGWKTVAPKLYIWDYAANFQYVLQPFPCLPAAQANMKYFLANGIDRVYEEGVHNSSHAADAELKCWVLAQLMWDPYQPLEPLLDRFFAGYYGEAAPMAREYHDLLQSLPRDESAMPMSMWGKLEDTTFTLPFLERAAEIWTRAAAAVADDPVRAENVRWARNAVDFMRVMRTTYAAPLRVTRHPEYVKSPAFESLREAAARITADYKREPIAAKFPYYHEYKAKLDQLLSIDPADVKASDRVEVEDRYFRLGGRPRPTRVKDAGAGDGRAIAIGGDTKPHGRWTANFYLNGLRFDPGVSYRLRVRARVDATGVPGEAFVAGTLDACRGNRRQIKPKGFAAAGFADGYRWVDVGEWKPETTESVWIAVGDYDEREHRANPAVKTVYIDKIEISRAEAR